MPTRRWAAVLRATAGALTGALVLVGLAASPAHAISGYGYDGTDPAATGCVNGSYAAYSTSIKNSQGSVIGTLELRYSPRCGTNWVRLNNTISGATALKSIERRARPRFWETEPDTATGWSYSMQVYAPGSTCVYIGGAIVGPGVTYGQTPTIRVC